MGAIHRVPPAPNPGIVYWFHGNSKSGKTNLAIRFDVENKVVLDADDLREVWTDLGFSHKDRWEQNLRLAKLAHVLMVQGYNVCIASICPYVDLRAEINKILPNVRWIYVNSPDSEKPSKRYPFEEGGWSDR
jgi:adenylylsulfate kinase-like enzyme